MIKFMLFIMLFSSAQSFASSMKLSVEKGVFTRHVRRRDGMNEDNELFAIELYNGNHGINISKFNNTYSNDTVSIGGAYKYFNRKYVELDLLYGVVKGYTQEQLKSVCHGDVCLYVAPRITAKYELGHNIGLKTSVQLFGSAVVGTVGVSYNF